MSPQHFDTRGIVRTGHASAIFVAAAEKIKVKGEIIDTWCYFSGVMGGPEAVTGSAHHTCALWCAAGGIPVGVLAEDGTVYVTDTTNFRVQQFDAEGNLIRVIGSQGTSYGYFARPKGGEKEDGVDELDPVDVVDS